MSFATMNSILNNIYHKYGKKIDYIIAGIWNTIFSYLIFIALYYCNKTYKLHIIIILICSQIISLTQAYVIYKFFVFKTKGDFVREYFRFYLVYGFSFIINIILIYIFVNILLLNPILSQGVIALIVVIISYLGHTNFSFMEKN
jgi:putative flippase GtrA